MPNDVTETKTDATNIAFRNYVTMENNKGSKYGVIPENAAWNDITTKNKNVYIGLKLK